MRLVPLAASTLVLLLGACPSDDDTSDDATGAEGSATASGTTDGATTTAADASTAASALGFTKDVWPILDANCSCHISPPPSGGPGASGILWGDPETAYATFVNQPSEVAGRDYVEPGSAADSYLYDKVAGTHLDIGGSGTIMPPGGMLMAVDLDEIAAWIDQGAAQ